MIGVTGNTTIVIAIAGLSIVYAVVFFTAA